MEDELFPSLALLAQIAVYVQILPMLEHVRLTLGDDPAKLCRASLSVEVNDCHPITTQSQGGCDAGGGRGFSSATFQVHDTDDLRALAILSARNVPAFKPVILNQEVSDRMELGSFEITTRAPKECPLRQSRVGT